jgi:hypothetical protein
MAAAETARLIASLTLDDKGFSKGLSNAEKSLGRAESTAFRIGQNIGRGTQAAIGNITKIGVVAGGALATQVVAGLRSLEELERATNATNAVIESTGGVAGVSAKEVRELAQELEQLTTADDKLIQSGQNMLLTFTNIGEEAFPRATKAMVNLGIAMADGDVANVDFQASAIQIGKALNDPIRGVTALRRVGIQFTKDQEKQIKVLVESGDVLGAQTLILSELERQFGKAGEAAGKGFGADMRRFQDAVEDGQQALARGFLPLITKVSQALSKRLADPATIAMLEDLGVGLADGFEDALAAAEKIPWASIGDAMRLAGTGAKAALDFFTSLPPWVQTAVITGWGLNKLTGGALGGIVGELAKGAIKGVLGIQAAQVNITAANVTGAGGVGGAAGAASKTGGVAGAIGKVFLVGAAAAVIAALVGVRNEQSDQNKAQAAGLTAQTAVFVKGATLDQMKTSLAGVDADIDRLNNEFSAQGVAFGFNIDGVRDAVYAQRDALAAAIASQTTRLEGAANRTKDDTVAATNRLAVAEAAQDAQTRATILSASISASAKETAAINAAKAANQQAAFAIRDRVTAGANKTASAIDRKDLSVEVNVPAPRVSIHTYISAQNTVKTIYRNQS